MTGFGTFLPFPSMIANDGFRQKPTFNVRPAGVSEGQNLAESGKAGWQR